MTLPESLTDPRSVAVVGASEDPAKWGYWLASGAMAGAHRREVWLVNRRRDALLGLPAYRAVEDLPSAPDLVALAVPAAQVCEQVEQATRRGTRSFLSVATGLGRDAAELRDLLAATGAHMVGPNSLGLYDADAELSLAWGRFRPGSLAVVSQSGQLGLEIAGLAERAGLGISRFCSVGDQLSVGAVDVLESLVDHERTRTVALYLESFGEGARLVEAVGELHRSGKRTLVLTTGASEGSRRLARTHTGSMTSAADVVDAACRASGALRVRTPRELVDVAAVLDATPSPAGARIAVVSDSGGQGGIAADVAVDAGLAVAPLSAPTQEGLRALLPAGAAVANPIDLAGGGEGDLDTYPRVAQLLARCGEVDAVLFSGYLGCYGADTPALADRELAVVRGLGRRVAGVVPVVAHSMNARSTAAEAMRAHRVPVFDDVAAAVGSLAGAVRLAAEAPRELKAPGTVSGSPVRPGYWGARALLAELGIAAPSAVLVRAPEDLAAVPALRFPLVLKAGWLAHKSELAGVRTGLTNPTAVTEAYEDMVERLGPGDYVVEEQDTRPGVVEMLVGGRRDSAFGPTVVVGAGGVRTELWKDVRVELAPVDHDVALRMIDSLRIRPLLDGWRGEPAVDLEGLAAAVVAVSERIAADPGIDEIEINPLRVAPRGAVAVDALATAAPATS